MTSAVASAEILPGYYLEPPGNDGKQGSGAWCSLPWPGDHTLDYASRTGLLPPSLWPGIVVWCEKNLVHHLTGDPWKFTGSQYRFGYLWYAVREDGRWLYRSGVKRAAKGAGKDPFLAALSLASLAGPVDFSHWDGAKPIGQSHRLALVQIAANSEAQGQDVLRVANAMASDAFRDHYGYDAGVLRSLLPTGSRIELLTNSERSSEGDPATAIFLNESHHMTDSSGGQALAGVARRNVGKSPGGRARILEATNAHLPGEGSVAEESYEAWQLQVAGDTRRQDILYDSREAAPHLRLHVEEELLEGIAQAYGDSDWIDQERIRDEAQDPRVPAADSIRFYFNALPTNEFAWVEPRNWDALARTEIVADAEEIALFLDCSKSSDATALCACRISDGYIFGLGVWQKPHGDRGKGWLAPRNEVDSAVRAAKEQFSVLWFGVDPSPARDDDDEALYWAALVDEWHRDFRDELALWATPGPKGSAVLFDMQMHKPGGRERNRLFTEMAELTAKEIDEDGPEALAAGTAPPLTHDGNAILRRHVHNARRRPNQWGMTLGKRTRDSSKLVDYAVTAVGARLGRRLILNSGKNLIRPTSGKKAGAVYGF